MNASNAARICETMDRLQTGKATKVDAELLATISGDCVGPVRMALFDAANAIIDEDFLQALDYLNDLEFVHVQSPS
jgi:hypothetical protein